MFQMLTWSLLQFMLILFICLIYILTALPSQPCVWSWSKLPQHPSYDLRYLPTLINSCMIGDNCITMADLCMYIQLGIIYQSMASTPYILILTTLLIVSTYSASLVTEQTNRAITIGSEQHLAEFLLAHLGQNSGQIADQIKQYIQQNNLSLMNAVQEIGLVFVAADDDQDANGFQITENFVKKMGENMNKLNAHFLIGQPESEVQKYIDENFNHKKYEQIKVTSNELSKIQALFITNTPRLLEQDPVVQPSQTPQTSFSYITKFFFSILFILVTFGTLISIASMNNRKDSLLYAKFLTDVSGR